MTELEQNVKKVLSTVNGRATVLAATKTVAPERINLIYDMGIHTIGELVAHTEQDLLDIRNFGMKSIDEVKEKLQSLGLALKASPLGNFDTNNLEGGTFFSPEDE